MKVHQDDPTGPCEVCGIDSEWFTRSWLCVPGSSSGPLYEFRCPEHWPKVSPEQFINQGAPE